MADHRIVEALEEALRVARGEQEPGRVTDVTVQRADYRPGCICPPTAEQTCMSQFCPRRPVFSSTVIGSRPHA